MPLTHPTFDITDAIAVLSNLRAERFRHERLVNLLTFSVWMFERDNPSRVKLARATAAALVIRGISEEIIDKNNLDGQAQIKTLWSEYLNPRTICDCLLDENDGLAFRWNFSEDSNRGDLNIVEGVLYYLLASGITDASQNKAVYFIARKNGFSKKYSHPSQNNYPQVKASTIIKAWNERLPVAPFELAIHLTKEHSLRMLTPDLRASLEIAQPILQADRLHKYFSCALFLQNMLLKRLNKSSKRRFQVQFTKFPVALQPYATELPRLTEKQNRLMRNYKA